MSTDNIISQTSKPVTLYYAPGACSLASHIILAETNSNYQLAKVNLKSHTLEDGSDYYKINPKGAVPALR
jgi:glutathione S-transferase